MNRQEKALRDAFLAECWKPVPEWRQTKDEREDAAARNAFLAPVDEAADSVDEGAA